MVYRHFHFVVFEVLVVSFNYIIEPHRDGLFFIVFVHLMIIVSHTHLGQHEGE